MEKEDDRTIVTTDLPGIYKRKYVLTEPEGIMSLISAGKGKEEETETRGASRKERSFMGRHHREMLLYNL